MGKLKPKISVLLPFYNRTKALGALVENYKRLYYDMIGEIELVLVDDEGSERLFDSFDMLMESGFQVSMSRPRLAEGINPGAVWNYACQTAQADVVAVSHIEILHATGVIPEAIKQIHSGDADVVFPTCLNDWYDPDEHSWISDPHPGGGMYLSPNYNCWPTAYFQVCKREFLLKYPYNEDYRKGFAWDDLDIGMLWKHRARARYRWLKYHVVAHCEYAAERQTEKNTPKIMELWSDNERIFRKKWGVTKPGKLGSLINWVEAAWPQDGVENDGIWPVRKIERDKEPWSNETRSTLPEWATKPSLWIPPGPQTGSQASSGISRATKTIDSHG
jgi:hypothetical protein